VANVPAPLARVACIAGLSCAWLAAGCARAPVQTTRLTSAEISTQLGEEATGFARQGASERALALADRAVMVSPASPWAHYDRAVALQALGRMDDAVEELRQAERYFGDADARGRSLAIYGRARALTGAGRCAEAHVAYQEYADLVRVADPRAAEMALAYASNCREKGDPAADRAATNATNALIAGDYRGTLEAAAATRASETSPWLEYDRAVALAELGRTDEAVTAFRVAERRFGDDENGRHGRAVAIDGRARALEKAGRCAEAQRACDEYASFTGDRGRCRRC
jgi:tetratricopeptide (TPR) repeat protein